jgi:SPP1 gp7 family putative phage head morphogenesis protein
MFNKEAKAFLFRFMDELRKKEAFEMVVLSNGYSDVIASLQDAINAISSLDAKSLNQLFREKRFRDFLQQADAQLSVYANNSGSLIGTIQTQFAQAGLQTTQGLLTTLTREFNLLPVDAINNIIGFTSDGSPLVDILLKRYGDSYKDVAQTLITSTAQGLNPKETAKLIGESLQGNLSDTLRIARTEQMRAFREASLMQMQESGVVDGWEWITEPDACEFCESMEGKVFPLDESMDTHPNCRCIQSPYIKR